MHHHGANRPTTPTDWNSVNWRKANRQVRNLRRRIFRATRDGDWKTVNRLQKLLLRSYSNRVLAVRRVTQVNHGRHTPGIDKVLVKTPAARGKLVDELRSYQPWRAKPTKRVYIPKANGTHRPLGIPVIRDRALQAMVKTALEPSWEARFEGSSYGFRPGRSCHDAIQQVYNLGRAGLTRHWILDADIEGAYDRISHAFLLETLGPCPGRHLIKQWLKAGYMECDTWHATEEGTPQGGVVSPLLLNVALHGMEAALGISHTRRGRNLTDRALVRYADDFVVFCRSQASAEQARVELATWLAQRGLALSEDKTRIVHIEMGFDFLGWHVRQYRAPATRSGWKLLIRPSSASIQRIKDRLRAEWLSLRGANVQAIVSRLNPVVRGWALYHRTQVASQTFHALDYYMYQREVRSVRYAHPRKSWTWLRHQYWGAFRQGHNDHWVFGDRQTGQHVLKFAWIPIRRHTLVRGSASPDDPALQDYWRQRAVAAIRTLSPSKQRLTRRQGGICPLCGNSLFNAEELHTHHVLPRAQGGTEKDTNLRLLHAYCHQQIHNGSPSVSNTARDA